MFNQTLFERVVGDTYSDAQITALGSAHTAYINNRNTALNSSWNYWGVGDLVDGVPTPHDRPFEEFTRVGVYDRAQLWYHVWKASGYTNTTARDRARAIQAYYLVNSTKNWTEVNYSPWLENSIGTTLYYADTGSQDALNWLEITSANWLSYGWLHRIGSTSATPGQYGYDGRTTGKGLTNLICAHLAGAPQTPHYLWGLPADPTMTREEGIRQALDQIVAGRNGNGIWRYPHGSGLMAKPWMIGIILDSLILYHEAFEPDPRIVPMVRDAAEYLYSGTSAALQASTGRPDATFYHPTITHAFYYVEGSTPDEAWPPGYVPHTPPNPSLEGLLINAYAFTYAKTGDLIWKTRALDILESYKELIFGPVLGLNFLINDFVGSKVLNEEYSFSYKTFPFLYNSVDLSTTGTLAATDTADTASVTGRTGTKIRLNWA
jgi:hypothetical protein